PQRTLRVPAPMTSRSCRAGSASGKKKPRSLDAVVEAEIRNSSRPGSQAPHAPPALTFGLPGKQKVKPVQAGGFLIRSVRHLPHINELLRMDPPARQRDLILQEINEFDPDRLQRLRIERRRGQARQRIGLKIDQPLR